MFNFASKTLSLFLDPLTLPLILLLLGWILRRRWRKTSFVFNASAILLFFAMGSSAGSQWLLRSLEKQYPDNGIAASATAQAIVVLGDAVKAPSHAHPANGLWGSSDRLLVAARLYRAGKAPLVVASGGNNTLLASGPVPDQADQMRDMLEEWGLPASAVLVEEDSINTRENAVFTRRLLAPRGIGQIILVTSAYHMPRAAASFRKVGFQVVAAPADFRTGYDEPIALVDWIPTAGSLSESSLAIHEWLGLLAYRLHGWA